MGNVKTVQKYLGGVPCFDAILGTFKNPKLIRSGCHREANVFDEEGADSRRSGYHSGHSGNIRSRINVFPMMSWYRGAGRGRSSAWRSIV